jgi:hypothetical protein
MNHSALFLAHRSQRFFVSTLYNICTAEPVFCVQNSFFSSFSHLKLCKNDQFFQVETFVRSFSHLPFLGTPRVYEVIREKYFKVKVISFPLSDMRKSSTSLDFNNFEKAYKHKTIAELVNALLVLRVCRVRKIVSNARYLVTLSYKILGFPRVLINITNLLTFLLFLSFFF